MSVDRRIEAALSSADPLGGLRSLVLELQAQGQEQSSTLQLFETTRQQLREAGRDRDEDIVLEVMDFLVGWCSPHMSLRPESPG